MNIKTEIEMIFRDKFNIPDEKHLYICGCNPFTLAEIIFYSTTHTTYSMVARKRPVSGLLEDILYHHGKKYNDTSPIRYAVQYDELISKVYTVCEKRELPFYFVYADKAFPYYEPFNYLFMVIGLGFLGDSSSSILFVDDVVMKKKYRAYFSRSEYSTFSLSTIFKRIHNPLVFNDLYKLKKNLLSFDIKEYKEKIDYNRVMLMEYLGDGGDGLIFTTRRGLFSQDILENNFIIEDDYGTHIDLYKNSSFVLEEIGEGVKSV